MALPSVVPGAAASLHLVEGTDLAAVVRGGLATAPGLDRVGDGRHLVLLGAVRVLPVGVSVRDEGRAGDHLGVVLVLVAETLVLLLLFFLLLLLLLLLFLVLPLLVVRHVLVLRCGAALLLLLCRGQVLVLVLGQLVAQLGHPVLQLPLAQLECLQLHLLALGLGEAEKAQAGLLAYW